MDEFELIGDMDITTEIYRKGSMYELRRQAIPLARYEVVYDETIAKFDQVLVTDVSKDERLTERFCWFLQTREGKSVDCGTDIELISSLARSARFKIRYKILPTKWTVIAESQYPRQPHFTHWLTCLEQTFFLFDHY